MSTLKQVMREANEAINRKSKPKQTLTESLGPLATPSQCLMYISDCAFEAQEKYPKSPTDTANKVAKDVMVVFKNQFGGKNKDRNIPDSWYKVTDTCSYRGDRALESVNDLGDRLNQRGVTDSVYEKFCGKLEVAKINAWKVVYYDVLYNIFDNNIQ
jgi:hypothetical protein